MSRPELLAEQVKQEMPSIPVCDSGLSFIFLLTFSSTPSFNPLRTEKSAGTQLSLFKALKMRIVSLHTAGKKKPPSGSPDDIFVLFSAQLKF